jgi:hypothetical protein
MKSGFTTYLKVVTLKVCANEFELALYYTVEWNSSLVNCSLKLNLPKLNEKTITEYMNAG